MTPERLELAAKVINLAEDGYNVHRNSLLGRMAGGPGVDHIYHTHKEFYAASYVELTLNRVPLGRAGMNEGSGIRACGEAREAFRVLNYEASSWTVSSSQARTSRGRIAPFVFCVAAPSW